MIFLNISKKKIRKPQEEKNNKEIKINNNFQKKKPKK